MYVPEISRAANETKNLKNSHSNSRILAILENESSICVQEIDKGILENPWNEKESNNLKNSLRF